MVLMLELIVRLQQNYTMVEHSAGLITMKMVRVGRVNYVKTNVM